jgi:arginine N-succinyltransferase
MMIIRPIEHSDLDQFEDLVEQTSFGLTTLPRDRDLLAQRIADSQRSFKSKASRPMGETYLFVMEDLEAGKVVGTCGISSKIGGYEPHYAYRIETTVHESTNINVVKEIQALHLVREHSGPSEVGSLFISPDYRKGGLGRLLSLSRFMFMAEFRERFEPTVIAEMRGVVDKTGHSPFWEALGRHFFDIDFPQADYHSMKDKRFIAELMPTHPIYIVLLPPEAQEVIGDVHPDTRPARRMLEDEGLCSNGMVDIFEAGPILSSPVEKVRTVRESKKGIVTGLTDEEVPPGGCILTNTSLDFRAVLGAFAQDSEGGVRISKKIASTLNVKTGDEIRFAPLRSGKKRASIEIESLD